MSSNLLTKTLSLSTLALCAALASGCTKSNDNLRHVMAPCTVQSDCADNQICTDEGCAPRGCRGDFDCQSGWKCFQSASTSFCAPDDGTPPTPIDQSGGGVDMGSGGGGGGGSGGLTCDDARPCASGQTCAGGRCYNVAQASCGVLEWSQCAAAADCGAGKSCIGGQCLTQCSASCGSGSACSNGVCVPQAGSQCIWDSDCGGRARCINGGCFSMCNADSQCGAADRCLRGTCRSK